MIGLGLLAIKVFDIKPKKIVVDLADWWKKVKK